MKIQNISPLNFSAKKPENIKKTKKIFYDNIDKYLNKEISKKEYMDYIIKNHARFKNNTPAENIYMNNLLTTLDLTGNPDNISDYYLSYCMTKLLKSGK